MFFNYFKTAFRNLLRSKGFSFINISGLAIGMSVGILILLYIYTELTYDRCHKKSDNIYRIAAKLQAADRELEIPSQAAPLAPALIELYPEVINAARLRECDDKIISYKENLFEETNIFYADPGVMDIFTITVVKGDPETFLTVPFSLVITEEMAVKYFGFDDPIGKILRWNDEYDYNITGVVKKLPYNSHLKFNMLASLSTLNSIGEAYEQLDQWLGFNFLTYIELQEGVPTEGLGEKYTNLVISHTEEMLKQMNVQFDLYLQPLRSIHLHSHLMGEIEASGNPAMLRLYTTVAIFIILIACINFMNLTTARSSRRAKEVGMRKVLGAYKKQLIGQYLGESLLLSLISIFFAVILVVLLLPSFNNLIGKELSFQPFRDWPVSLGLILLTLIIGLVAGMYPAFFLTSFRPINSLKEYSSSRGRGHKWFRDILVSLQYVISIVLVICTWIIYNQLNFVKNYNLGFNKERVAVIPLLGQAEQQYELLKSQVLQMPGVESAAVSSMVPGIGMNETRFTFEGSQEEENRVLSLLEIDEDYLETMNIPVISGRNFSRDYPSDKKGSFLINETLCKELGWKDPIGKRIFMTEIDNGELVEVPYSVVGVVRDFHFESLHTPIRAQVIRMINEIGYLSVKLKPETIVETLEKIEDKWTEIEPTRPFSYSFLDDSFDRHYRTELRLGQIFIAFTIIAILIACLGLFGLTSFSVEQKTKEIGIRKVLGATVNSIIVLLSKEFIKWVILANIIAWPIAYYAMSTWLRHFAYRVSVDAWIFFISGLLALFIALITINLQAIKAAYSNPVDAIKYE